MADKISVEFLVDSKKSPRRIVSVSPDDEIMIAAKVLKSANVGLALVMEKNKLVGVISERDIVRRWVNSPQFPKSVKVQDVMTKKVEYVTAFDNVQDCYLRFKAAGCRHLPVLDPLSQVIGVLSIRDVSDFMVQELSRKENLVKAKKPTRKKK